MYGAREYYNLLKTGRYGRLYMIVGTHARGHTLHIFVLPKGKEINGTYSPWIDSGAVEVYGVVSGNPGWSETYGWIHKGEWQKDFQKLVDKKRDKIKTDARVRELSMIASDIAEKNKIHKLLSEY